MDFKLPVPTLFDAYYAHDMTGVQVKPGYCHRTFMLERIGSVYRTKHKSENRGEIIYTLIL